MSRRAKLGVLPIRYAVVVGLLVILAFAASRMATSGVSAQQVPIECQGRIVDNECVEEDACWNLDGSQATVPPGYHTDPQNKDNTCIEDKEEPLPPQGEVLGAQVLAESTGK
jgi:hypothetical protein